MPKNPGSYSLLDVPPAPGDGSRFYLARTTGGWKADPGEQLGDAAMALARARRSRQPKADPPKVTVKLKYATAAGLQDRGEVTGPQTLAATRPGRLGQTGDLAAGSLLDSFLLGEEAWKSATDAQVWEALRATVEAHELTGSGLRELNDGTALAICARAGLHVSADALPHPFKAQQPPKSPGSSNVVKTVDGERVKIVKRRGDVLVAEDGREFVGVKGRPNVVEPA
ncbi:MAG TPA: hypothetical protein VK915_03835 [Gaiellaceae bacterium]|nr:hypothetical protein [Gaiellaceae bacterium]